jgi:hypothetical protein
MGGAYPLAWIMPHAQPPLRPVFRFSGLARPIDPAYPTNKAVLLFAPVVFLLGALYAYFGGATLGGIVLAGLNASLLLFFTWALTRELTPDDNPAAFLAVGLALVAWPRVGLQSILTLAAIMVLARLVSRSTGKPATIVDSVLVTAGIAAMTWLSSWTFGVIGALAFSLDAILPVAGTQARRRDHLAFAVALMGVTVARVLVGIEPLRLPAHLPVWALIAGLCALAIWLYPRPRSVGDVDQLRLEHARVRGALAVGLISAILLSIDGGVNLFKIVGVWACILAVPLGLPFARRRRKKPSRKTSRKIEELLGRSETGRQSGAAVGQQHDRPPLGNE